MDCGAYLRSHDMSLDRGRFDFARVLISAPSLDIVSCVDNVLIDGKLVEIKIVEEWGFNIGEDACLFENDEDQKSESDTIKVHGDTESCKNVDTLVDKLMKEIEEEVVNSDNEGRDVDSTNEVKQLYLRLCLF